MSRQSFAPRFAWLFFLMAVSTGALRSATINSIASGNWSNGRIWSGGVVPGPTDTAVISTGDVVNVDGARTVGGLSVSSGGQLTLTFDVSGAASFVDDGFVDSKGGTLILDQSGGSIAGTGTFDAPMSITGTYTILPGSSLTFDVNSTITIAGAVSNSGAVMSKATSGITGGGGWTNNTGSILNVAGPLLPSGTLDASASSNGVKYSGASQAVHPATYWDLSISGTGTATLAAPASLGGLLQIDAGSALKLSANLTVGGDVVIIAGGTLDAGNATVKVGSNWQNAGTFVPGTSTVDFNGNSFNQQISATTFNDLVVSGITGATANGNLNVLGKFTLGASSWFDASTYTHTFRGDFDLQSAAFYSNGATLIFNGGNQSITGSYSFGSVTLSGTGTKTLTSYAEFSGLLLVDPGVTFSLGTNSVTLRGNLTVNGTFDTGTGRVTFTNASLGKIKPDALGSQIIDGSTGTTFYDLTIDNTNGVVQTIPLVNVTHAIDLTNGVYETGANKIHLTAPVTVTRGSGWIFGELLKDFTAGTTADFEVGTLSAYGPATATFTGSGSLAVRSGSGTHPAAVDPANVLGRYWNVFPSGINVSALLFSYPAADVNGTESSYIVGMHNGTNWTYPAGSVDSTNHTFNFTGSLVAPGSFTAGAAAALGGPIASFKITGAATQIAGTNNALTITALDSTGGVAITYTGAHALTFSGLGSSTNPVTAPTVTDQAGTAVAFGSPTTLNFVNGIATVSGGANGSLVAYKAETANVAATESTIGTSVPLNLTVSASAYSKLRFLSLSSPQTSGLPFTGANILEAEDVYGNAAAFDASVNNVTLAANSPLSGTISGLGSASSNVLDRAADFVAGQADLSALGMTYTGLAQTGTFTATPQSGPITTSGNVTINAGPVNRLVVVLPGETATPGVAPGKSGTPTAQTAGVAFNGAVYAYDSAYNVDTASIDTIHVTSTDAAAINPPDAALSGGSRTFSITLKTAGTQTVQATDVPKPSVTAGASAVAVGPGPLTNFLVEQSGGGAIQPQVAGSAFNIRITARDANGNTVTSFNGTVQLTSNATMSGAPVTSGSFVNGVLASQPVTITSAQTGTTITASDSAPAAPITGTSAPFTVNAGAVGTFLVESSTGGNIPTQTAGVNFSILIKALDSFGNVNTSFTGTVTLTTTAGAISPSAVTFTAGNNGVATASVFVTKATPSATITALSGSASGTSNTFVVNAGALSSFAVEAPGGGAIGSQLVDSTFDIQIRAIDSFGNTVPSFNGTVVVSSSIGMSTGAGTTPAFTNGVLNPYTVAMNSTGVATITATSGAISGTSNPFDVDAACGVTPLLLSPENNVTGHSQGVTFYWTTVPNGTLYNVWVSANGAPAAIIGSSTTDYLIAGVPAGTISWYVEALSSTCPPVVSPTFTFTTTAGCAVPDVPLPSVVGEVTSNERYSVNWTLRDGSSSYDVQESTTADFSTNVITRTVTGNAAAFQHTATVPTGYYYRIRAIADCSNAPSAFSLIVRVVVVPPPPATQPNPDVTTPFGSTQLIIQKIFLPGQGNAKTALDNNFTATTNRSWMTVSPASGSIPPSGTTLTVTVDPKNLPVGTNTGTVSVTSSTGQSIASVPVSVNLVTPISPLPKTGAPITALVIPSVGHLDGQNSHWQSDIRIANVTSKSLKYLLTFTPSNTDGSVVGKQTTIDIPVGQTVALDDIVKRWYGLGSLGDGANGVLDLRNASGDGKVDANGIDLSGAIASSRTYNTTGQGTLGQFVPATPFASFIGAGSSKLSLQQIAQNSSYRTNIGIVEAAGEPAQLELTFFDADGHEVLRVPESLRASEHKQLDQVLAKNNVTLDDGRVEVQVVGGSGKVMAYASIVDNRTNDPLLVSPATLPMTGAKRYVVPGVADLDNPVAHWRTDMRIFNSDSAPADVTLTFYPEGAPESPKSATITVAPGTIREVNDVLADTFGAKNTGGAVAIDNPSSKGLVITARTYNSTSSGTYGQYIPAVTEDQAASTSTRGLELLQVEDSDRFRTNIGLVEVSGQSAKVELTFSDPYSKATPVYTVDLKPNEFRQLNGIIKQLGGGQTYNSRVTVKVVSGSGKVSAYASVVDNQTQDPTYVPAQ